MPRRPQRYFLDTNVLVYTFDRAAEAKRRRALELVEEALTTQRGVISTQVVQELLNVALRRFAVPLTPADARDYLERVLAPLCEVYPSVDLYKSALDLGARWGFSFYDSLIVAAALEAGCRRLYSEDLQHRQRVLGLEIVDPFR